MVRGCDDRSIRQVNDDDDDDDDDDEQATTTNHNNTNNTGDGAIIRPVPVRLTPGMSTRFAFVSTNNQNNNNNNNNGAIGTTAYIPSHQAQDDTYPAGILIDDDDNDVENSDDHVATISHGNVDASSSIRSSSSSMMHQHDLLFSMDDAGPSVCCVTIDNETEDDNIDIDIDRPPEYYDQSISRDETVIYNNYNNTQEEMERMAHYNYNCSEQHQHQYELQQQYQQHQYNKKYQSNKNKQATRFKATNTNTTESHPSASDRATNSNNNGSAYVGSLDTALSKLHKMRKTRRNHVVPTIDHPEVEDDDHHDVTSSKQQNRQVMTCGLLRLRLPTQRTRPSQRVELAKTNLLHALAISAGDSTDPRFVHALDSLMQLQQKTTPPAQVTTSMANHVHDKNELLLSKQRQLQVDSLMQLQQKTTPPAQVTTSMANHVHDKNELLLSKQRQLQGVWWNLCKPNYHGCLGMNATDDPMYHLGRLSFDMFGPKDLVVSVQATFNTIRRVTPSEFSRVAFPKRMIPQAVDLDKTNNSSSSSSSSSSSLLLQTYNIVTAFTIETTSPSFGESSPNDQVVRPMKGIMTTRGYSMSDPSQSDTNRVTIWFTGGKMEFSDDECDVKLPEWKRVFGDHLNYTHHSQQHFGVHVLARKCKELAFKLLLGASIPNKLEDDGSMSYAFESPMGGHGSTYCDILYLDDTIRIMQGNHGTIYVFSRMANNNNNDSLSS
eukprot:CAMPEP_0198302922 /NCGR_PEP_ID=MMETSP1449-20131203/56620_1 /TAXON_ID=420275 /ORGANISM="Attheya septentrionalis, Strain CCMP2084" /LENGTH=719 /DNA_ID=CAMNT_0044005401 /DNA_START=187 /DNA_END=2346 /DNA_ORIENTATION=-